MANVPTTNRYVSGSFAPIGTEITVSGDDLEVVGTIPEHLAGRYLRNGPNPMKPVNESTHHWFLGDGMVHGIRLAGGAAHWYRNRFVGSDTVVRARGGESFEGPNWNNGTLGPNTNVAGFASRTLAAMEAGSPPVELTYELESLTRTDFGGTLPNGFSGHSKYDPTTGEIHTAAYAWPGLDHIQYLIQRPDGSVKQVVEVPVIGMTMMHDMSITEQYAIFYDQPVTVNLDMVATHPFPFSWNPSYGNRVGLLARAGLAPGRSRAENVVWVDVPVGYVFHPLNAYDHPETGHVIIDLCFYPKMFEHDLLGPFGDSLARLERWTINVAARTMSIDIIDDTPSEFPRHASAVGGLAYRYGYLASPSTDSVAGWPTFKYDLRTGERQVFDHGPGRACGEPVFVSRPDANAEDDGWLMSFVHDLGSGSAEFVIWDAQDFSRGYAARVKLPQRIPFGFHGNWVND